MFKYFPSLTEKSFRLSVLLIRTIRTHLFFGRRTSVFVVYWLARPTTDLKDPGSNPGMAIVKKMAH